MIAVVALGDQITEMRKVVAAHEAGIPMRITRGSTEAEETGKLTRLKSILATLEWVKKNEQAIKGAVHG